MSEDATAELSETDKAKALQTGLLMHRIAGISPAMRRKVLGVIKDAAPEYPIPELDLEADMERRVTEKVKPFEDSTAALTAEVRALKTELARKDMKGKLGLDEDELVEVETLAKEKGISNVETATEFYQMRAQVLGTPRGTRDPGAEDYQTKLRKVNPRNHQALKRAAIDEGARILRSLRRAG